MLKQVQHDKERELFRAKRSLEDRIRSFQDDKQWELLRA
jgi:hypothetical protein